MLFGQPITDPARVSFVRPPQASPNFRPGLPQTGFYSHLRPFAKVMLPYAASPAYYPQLDPRMGPNPIPAAAPAPLPAAASAVSPSVGPTNGMFGASFGGGSVSPYKVMRMGLFPTTRATATAVRNPALQAGQIVRALTPSGYQQANVPGGVIVPGAVTP